MIETTKNHGRGDSSAGPPDEDLDLDLDFDLEALAGAPPPAPAPPAVPDAPPEPEVVVFSRGNVKEVDRGPAGAPLPPVFEPGAPEELAEDPGDLGALLSAPAERLPEGGVSGAAEEAPEDPFHPLGADSGAMPEATGERDEALVLRKPGGVGRGADATQLPLRRGEVPATARTEEWTVPPDRQKRASVALGSRDVPSPSEVRPTRTRSRKSRAAAATGADEAMKSLWGGRGLDDEDRAPASNRRRTGAGLAAQVTARMKAIPPRWLAIGGGAAAFLVALVAIPWGRGGDGAGGEGSLPDGVEGAGKGTGTGTSEPAVARSQPLDQAAVLAAIEASSPEARILAQYSELARESAGRFFAATTVEEMLAVVRDPERVEPLMREFYSRNPLRPRELLNLTLVAGDDAMVGTKVFWKTKVDLKEEGREELVFEQLKTGSRKAFLVDWETAVNYNPMRWDAFAAEQPAAPIAMRAFVTLSGDYRPPFTDEARYAAFLLTHPDGAAEILAYAEREGEAGRRLLEIAEDDFEVRAYVSVRFPPEGMASAEILGFLDAVDWIIVE